MLRRFWYNLIWPYYAIRADYLGWKAGQLVKAGAPEDVVFKAVLAFIGAKLTADGFNPRIEKVINTHIQLKRVKK